MAHAIHIFLLLSHVNHGLDAIAAWFVCVWCHCTIFNPVWIFWSLYKPLLLWMLSKGSQVWGQCWGNNRTDTDWDSKYDVITDRIKDGHRKKNVLIGAFASCVLVIIFVDVFCSTLSVSGRPLFTTGPDHSWLYTECSSQISLTLLNCTYVTNCVCVCLYLQENLLQSVLPVYISMKMKLAIMERLQDCKDKEEQQRLVKDNNFKSLYVKRHENVRYNRNHLWDRNIILNNNLVVEASF